MNTQNPLKATDIYQKAYSGLNTEFFTTFNPDLIQKLLLDYLKYEYR